MKKKLFVDALFINNFANDKSNNYVSKKISLKIFFSHYKKARGMMFRKKAFPIIFPFKKEQIIAIHMFFVFFPLRVLWVNSNGVIVDDKILKPFSFYSPKKKASYIIELPINIMLKKNITNVQFTNNEFINDMFTNNKFINYE